MCTGVFVVFTHLTSSPTLAWLTFGVSASPILTSVISPVREDSGIGTLVHPNAAKNPSSARNKFTRSKFMLAKVTCDLLIKLLTDSCPDLVRLIVVVTCKTSKPPTLPAYGTLLSSSLWAPLHGHTKVGKGQVYQ